MSIHYDMRVDARSRPPLLGDNWHPAILAVLGVLLGWNSVAAWLSLPSGSEPPLTSTELRALHFRVFIPALAYALLALRLGVARARRGGSIASYGVLAVVTMLAAVTILFATFGVRTIG